MYNRYLDETEFHPVPQESELTPPQEATGGKPAPLRRLLAELGGKKNAGEASGTSIVGIFDRLDKGDMLLLLILLALLWEGEDQELPLLLGLLLLDGLF